MTLAIAAAVAANPLAAANLIGLALVMLAFGSVATPKFGA